MRKKFLCRFISLITVIFILSGCNKSPDEYFQEGLQQYNTGNFSEAIKNLSKAVDLEPENVKARFFLGMSYKNIGDVKKAVEQIDYSRQLNPEDFFILLNLADCYMKLGIFEQALKWVRESLKIKPDFMDSHLLLGVALLKSGNTQPAKEEIDFILKVTDKDNDSYMNSQAKFTLSEIYMKDAKYQDCVTVLKELLQKEPDSPLYIYSLGLAYAKMNDQTNLKEQIKNLEAIGSPFAKELQSLVK